MSRFFSNRFELSADVVTYSMPWVAEGEEIGSFLARLSSYRPNPDPRLSRQEKVMPMNFYAIDLR